MMFLNMNCKIELGKVRLSHVNSFVIDESFDEISNTAKIMIPRHAHVDGMGISQLFNVGDKVTIDAGYNGSYDRQFSGYIREIEAEIPLIVHCDDEMYILRRTNYIKSYKSDTTLKEMLIEIIPPHITIDCPDMVIGKYEIDNLSAFAVLGNLAKDYNMYSRLQDNVLSVSLKDIQKHNISTLHKYTIGRNVKQSNLKFKRKEDYKLKVKLSNKPLKGKRLTVEYPKDSNEHNSSVLQIVYPTADTEKELLEIAKSIYENRCYDGYTGTVTGFGQPTTHVGDALELRDESNPSRGGTYIIERVNIEYNISNGFKRENTLGYLLNKAKR